MEQNQQALTTQVLDASILGQSPDTKVHNALSEVKLIVKGAHHLKSPSSGTGFLSERSATKHESIIDASLGLRLKLSPKIEPKFKAKLKNKVE